MCGMIPARKDLNIGLGVEIETKRNQGTGKLTAGTIREILTASKYHPHGIKVRLHDGSVGRVKKVTRTTKTAPSNSSMQNGAMSR